MATTTTTTPSLPSPPSHGGGGSTSSTAVNIILSFLALICVPLIIYGIFFCLKCPPRSTVEWRRRRNSSDTEVDGKAAHMDLIYKCSKKKKKMEGENDDVDYDGECPVCLSMYVDGDEVRVLNVCKHRFHVSCINKWLVSHNNCPVCRASVRGSKQRVSLSMAAAADDLRQGLPDSSSMV